MKSKPITQICQMLSDLAISGCALIKGYVAGTLFSRNQAQVTIPAGRQSWGTSLTTHVATVTSSKHTHSFEPQHSSPTLFAFFLLIRTREINRPLLSHTVYYQCLHHVLCLPPCLLSIFPTKADISSSPWCLLMDMTPATPPFFSQHIITFSSLLGQFIHMQTHAVIFPMSNKTKHPSLDHTCPAYYYAPPSKLLEDLCIFALSGALIILFKLPSIQFPPHHNYSKIPFKL